MERWALSYLNEWKARADRKPLLLRGARQVGKSWLAGEFGRRSFDNVATVDFERNPEFKSVFLGRPPAQALEELSVIQRAPFRPGHTLLFLDEIQAVPQMLSTLRRWYEELPAQHVIAAGSLLDFSLRETPFSVPVGRIEYLYLEPLTFTEFLEALGEERLGAWLKAWQPGDTVPELIHSAALELFRLFAIVGGMPAVVAHFALGRRLSQVSPQHGALLQSFRDDFSKYGSRREQERLRLILRKLPQLVGRKFVYSAVDPGEDHRAIKHALELLVAARLATKVFHTAATGLPLGADRDERRFKVIFLDSGLMLAAAGLGLTDVATPTDLLLGNEGALAEQAVGQALRALRPAWLDPELHYWIREGKAGNAEVDYVLQQGQRIVPVECKSGRTGSLRSLHQFMATRRGQLGIRFNTDAPSVTQVDVQLHGKSRAEYQMLSLPLYFVDQLGRLVDGWSSTG